MDKTGDRAIDEELKPLLVENAGVPVYVVGMNSLVPGNDTHELHGLEIGEGDRNQGVQDRLLRDKIEVVSSELRQCRHIRAINELFDRVSKQGFKNESLAMNRLAKLFLSAL